MGDFSDLKNILSRFDPTQDRFISREFQKYGYTLAEELGDLEHKSLYIKLAKETPRHLLEEARRYVADAQNIKSKPRLFMWRLKQLRDEWKQKKSKIKNQKSK